MTTIFEQHGGGTAGTTHWLVTRHEPPGGGLPGLIRFQKSTSKAKQLDQVAQWLPDGRWAVGRWQPRPPMVPKWLVERVEAALLQGLQP
jgi:hypothetical protein